MGRKLEGLPEERYLAPIQLKTEILPPIWNFCQVHIVRTKNLKARRSVKPCRQATDDSDQRDAALPARRHRGDIMSAEKRSALMSRIKGRNTGPERIIGELLSSAGLSYETHARDLPGRPDFLFRDERVAVLIDGDFWHGWRFPVWRDKLSEAWEAKIEGNRRRDQRNMRRLRHRGWCVIRLWEHQIKRDPSACIVRVLTALSARSSEAPPLDNS